MQKIRGQENFSLSVRASYAIFAGSADIYKQTMSIKLGSFILCYSIAGKGGFQNDIGEGKIFFSSTHLGF